MWWNWHIVSVSCFYPVHFDIVVFLFFDDFICWVLCMLHSKSLCLWTPFNPSADFTEVSILMHISNKKYCDYSHFECLYVVSRPNFLKKNWNWCLICIETNAGILPTKVLLPSQPIPFNKLVIEPPTVEYTDIQLNKMI